MSVRHFVTRAIATLLLPVGASSQLLTAAACGPWNNGRFGTRIAAKLACALRHLPTALLITVTVAPGLSVAQAAGWYDDVLPVPPEYQLPAIGQPSPTSCVPTCANTILQDMNLPNNPQMAAGYYTPKAGTGLWSAARDLKLNGGINSSLYGRSQMPSALNMMGQLAVDQSVIVAVCCPTGLSPTGHAI